MNNLKISKVLVHLGLITVSLCLLILALEVTWRFGHLGNGVTWVFIRKDGYMKFDPEVRHKLTSNYTINEHGFRNKSFQIKKHPNVYRIVTLGASSTFGYENEDSGTYPYLLEQKFSTDVKIEVINAGIPYITSSQIRNLFEKEVLAMKPDMVTIYVGWNDADQAVYQLSFFSSFIRWLRMNSELASFVQMRLINFMESHPGLPQSIPRLSAEKIDEAIARAATRLEENILAIIKLCREKEITPLIILQTARPPDYGGHTKKTISKVPYRERVRIIREQLESEGSLLFYDSIFYVHGYLQDRLADIARDKQILLVDGILSLDEHPEYLVSHVHLNKKGNDIIASIIYNKAVLLRK